VGQTRQLQEPPAELLKLIKQSNQHDLALLEVLTAAPNGKTEFPILPIHVRSMAILLAHFLTPQ
jgi:hypothetical protein